MNKERHSPGAGAQVALKTGAGQKSHLLVPIDALRVAGPGDSINAP